MKHYVYAVCWMAAAAFNIFVKPLGWIDYVVGAGCFLMALGQIRKARKMEVAA